jgi:hypothetical protein
MLPTLFSFSYSFCNAVIKFNEISIVALVCVVHTTYCRWYVLYVTCGLEINFRPRSREPNGFQRLWHMPSTFMALHFYRASKTCIHEPLRVFK